MTSTASLSESDDPAADRVEIVVDDEASAQRLDVYLAAQVPELGRARLQALIRAGQVRVDAAPVTEPKRRVAPGMRIEVAVPPPEPAKAEGQPIPLEIVYEDAHLIVIDKPAGLVVHPAAGHADGTLVNALIAHCGAELSGIGGVARPGIVHRLDKETSGLLVVAKSDAAHQGLAAQFADSAEWVLDGSPTAAHWLASVADVELGWLAKVVELLVILQRVYFRGSLFFFTEHWVQG